MKNLEQVNKIVHEIMNKTFKVITMNFAEKINLHDFKSYIVYNHVQNSIINGNLSSHSEQNTHEFFLQKILKYDRSDLIKSDKDSIVKINTLQYYI